MKFASTCSFQKVIRTLAFGGRGKFDNSFYSSRSEVNKFVGPKARARELSHANSSGKYSYIYIYFAEGVRAVAWQQCGNKVGMTSDKGRLLGSNRLEDRLASDAIRSCYATQPVSTGQKRPGLVTIKENGYLTMAHSHVYSLRAERVIHRGVKNV